MNTLTRNEFWTLWTFDWKLRIREFLASTITPDVELRTIAKQNDVAHCWFNVGNELFFKLQCDYYARKELEDKWHVHLRIVEATMYDTQEEFEQDRATHGLDPYQSLDLKRKI